MRTFAAAVLFAILLIGSNPVFALDIKKFEGVFVGVSEDFDGAGHKVGERHVDMVITLDGSKEFVIELTSVRLVDGRRDVQGVRRRAFEARFGENDDGTFFLAKSNYNPFSETTSSEIFAGEPLEWAQIDENSLVIYTFAVLEDGRYESQVYERTLDGNLMRTMYQRHLDGELQRQTSGSMVRSD